MKEIHFSLLKSCFKVIKEIKMFLEIVVFFTNKLGHFILALRVIKQIFNQLTKYQWLDHNPFIIELFKEHDTI